MAKFVGAACAWLVAVVTCVVLWNGAPASAGTLVASDDPSAHAAQADRAPHTVAATPAAELASPDAEVDQEDGEPQATLLESNARRVRSHRGRLSRPDAVFPSVDPPPILRAPIA